MFKLKIWQDVFKQLNRNKRQSFLTLIAVAISVFIVLVILSSAAYTNQQLASDLEIAEGKFITLTYTPTDRNSLKGFTTEDERLVADLAGADKVERLTSSQDITIKVNYQTSQQDLTFRSVQDVLLNGVTFPSVIAGEDLLYLDQANQIALSDDTVKALTRQDNETALLGQTITINDQDFEVVSIYYASSTRQFVPQMMVSTAGKDVLLDGVDYAEQLVLETQDMALVYQALSTLDQAGSHRAFGSYNFIDNQKVYEDSKAQVQSILNLIAILSGISIFVSGFGVMNAMLSSVSERRKEIAIRRALGARRKDIQLSYMIEGTMLSVLGGLVGLGATGLFMLVMNGIGLTASLSLFQILFTLLATLVCGLIFTLVPSQVAAHKNVVEGLKA